MPVSTGVIKEGKREIPFPLFLFELTYEFFDGS